MTDAVKTAMEAVHAALDNNNEALDEKIGALREALAASSQKSVVVDKERLPQNNRQGRKMMQTYFKKRGVVVEFPKDSA